MKKIAVLIHSFTHEYAIGILDGILDYYKDKDVQVIMCQTKEEHSVIGQFEYQCWTGKSYLNADEIDGVILVAGSYSSTFTPEEIKNAFSSYNKVPVVSISLDLDMENAIYTHTECNTAISKIIKHLKEKHNCKNIGFFSANKTGSPEALARFDAYKKGLQENDLSFDSKLIFEGSFTTHTAYTELSERIKTKEDLKADAIICANDLMLLGCIKRFNELGIKVPEDVKLVGFDNSLVGQTSSPKFSTIEQSLFNQGQNGARILLEKLEGKKIQKEHSIPVKPIYRQTCGCIPLSDTGSIFKNEDGVICNNNLNHEDNHHKSGFIQKLNSIYEIFDLLITSNTMQQLFYSMKYFLRIAGLSNMTVCLFDEPVHLLRTDVFVLPDKMHVSMIIDEAHGISQFEPSAEINPYKKIFPPQYSENLKGNYILQPIFSGETNYGYLICNLNESLLSIYAIILKILNNAIAHAYAYTKLEENNSALNLESKTDELTKILNRRGFLDLGQKSIDIANEMQTYGMVFFLDLDGLKTINDTYGHEMGDLAIQTMAEALKQSLRVNDVIGRLSGDEFAVVAVGLKPQTLPKIRAKITDLCCGLSLQKELPFTVSCSMGAVCFSSTDHNLSQLLLQADKLLYQEKRIKHSQKK